MRLGGNAALPFAKFKFTLTKAHTNVSCERSPQIVRSGQHGDQNRHAGKKVFWTDNHIYRLRNGMIAETRSEPSFHDLMAQIKGTKAAGQAVD